MVTAGLFSLLGAVFYLPALRAERERDRAKAAVAQRMREP